MNGDISRIPIQTLGAVQSLTDILPELPLPSNSSNKCRAQSLLFDEELAVQANILLSSRDSQIGSLLSQALVHTSTDNMHFNHETAMSYNSERETPTLLSEILSCNKLLLQEKLGFKDIYNSTSFNEAEVPVESIGNSVDESSESHFARKKKKKKKKKKRKYKEASSSDSEDVSKASDNESEAPRLVSVVKVDNNDEKKISLKISFKKPQEEDSGNIIKKDKKKHKHRDRDKLCLTVKKTNGNSVDPPTSTTTPTESANTPHPSESKDPSSSINGDQCFDNIDDFSLFDSKHTNNNNNETSFLDQFIKDNPISFNDQSSSHDIALVEDIFKKELQDVKKYQNNTSQSIENTLSHLINSTSQPSQEPNYSSLNDIFNNQSNLDIGNLPGGLESYLNSSNISPSQINSTLKNQNKPNSLPKALPNQGCKPRVQLKRNLPGSINSNPNKKTKRRKNELEGLQSWKMNYSKTESASDPSGEVVREDGWDKTLNSLSNTMHERIKRRKRNGPTSCNNSQAFIYEEDDDYPKKSSFKNGTDETGDGGSSKDVLGRRNNKNNSYIELDDSDEEKGHDRSINGRRKKTDDDDKDFEVAVRDIESKIPHLQNSTDNRKKPRQRLTFQESVIEDELKLFKKSSNEYGKDDGGESSTAANLNRFSSRIDEVFEEIEDVDLSQFFSSDDPQSKIPPETIVPISELVKLCQDASKLKALRITNQVEKESLIKLLSLLLLNIRDGQGVVATFRHEENTDNENKLWRELAMERVTRSILSVQIGIHLMTSPDMPKEIYLEDFLEKAVQLLRFQLNNTIFPEYDPVYRVDGGAKDNLNSIKGKRARHKIETKMKSTIQLYHRIVECISELGELIDIQGLTDGIVLTLSSIGVSVFFVESVNELQLAGLKLVTAIFYHYESHRKLIIEDILASLSRLPTSKKNLRTYRLNSEDSIQMLTALALMLVQSVSLPDFSSKKSDEQKDATEQQQDNSQAEESKKKKVDELSRISHEDEIKMMSSYQNAMRTAHMFLSAFLRKSTIKGEDDHRAIFENFVNDLLLTLNKPEWPAAEVMLSMLGTLLVQQFNNKHLDQATRVASVDYLGTVASTLRRDAVSSQLRERDIDNIIKSLLNGKDDEEESSQEEDNNEDESKPKISKQKTLTLFAKMDRIQALRDALLDYLMDASDDPTSVFARRFYLSQWLSDCSKEHEKARLTLTALNNSNRDVKNALEDFEDEETSEILKTTKQEATNLQQAERRRKYIQARAMESISTWTSQRRLRANPLVHLSNITSGHRANGQLFGVIYKSIMDYEDACIICKYLASMRPFSQSFDIYLSQICKLLGETSVAVRTKALRCLSAVVEADPDILARGDIERAVHHRLLDTSTSVREAAIDLLSRFIACKPELSIRYYQMFSDRILDKGVSVRKRVIKILRDICLEQPDFPKIPEICVKMIRRINDEEGIKKLVYEVFQTMWFTPIRDKDSMNLYRRVMNITDVVIACQKTGLEWFEQFLQILLKREENEKLRPVEKACDQIVDCLMQNVIRLEEVSDKSNKRLLACLATLHLITNIRPELMIDYAMQLQPYLSISCSDSSDMQIIHHVARILELTVPLMEHPSDTMIGKLEEEMVWLTLKYGKLVLEACVGCLGAIVNKVSKNFQLVRDCFHRFYGTLVKCRQEVGSNISENDACHSITIPFQYRSSLMRALFTVGLLCKHFSPEVLERGPEDANLLNSVFDNLMFFLEFSIDDLQLRKNALSGLGFLCSRHHELLFCKRMTRFYQYLLQFPSSPPQLTAVERRRRLPAAARHLKDISDSVAQHQDLAVIEMKCLVLENLLNFFHEEEKRMLDHDSKWKIHQNRESLKEMGDVASGTGSLVAQTYLKDILESFYCSNVNVRLISLQVIMTILRQGLIHPIITVPYLISMQTDTDPNVRVKADAQLNEIETKFPGFVNMRAAQGIFLSYRLQFVLYSEVTSDAFKIKQQEAANKKLNSNIQTDSNSTTPISMMSKKTPTTTPRRSSRHFPSKEDEDTGDGISYPSSTSANTLQESFGSIRGSWNPESEVPNALNSQLYAMLRSNRSQRRAFLNNLINLFDDNNVRKRCSIRRLVYVADNLAYFPYQMQDEPLFLVHHIDLLVGTVGTNLLSNVRDALFPEVKAKFEEVMAEKSRADQQAKYQLEHSLRENLARHQMAMQEAMMRHDHATAQMEHQAMQNLSLQLQQIIVSNNNAFNSPPHVTNHNAAKNFPKFATCMIDPEEEENEEILVNRLDKYSNTAMTCMREAIKASRACILLIRLKQYLREVYSLTDAKIQKYSPSDSAKIWERPLTRKVGVRFHPSICLRVAGSQMTTLLHSLHDDWNELWKHDESPLMRHFRQPPLKDDNQFINKEINEKFSNFFNDDAEDRDSKSSTLDNDLGEVKSESLNLIQEYLEFRKLILTIEHFGAGDEDMNGIEVIGNQQQQQQEGMVMPIPVNKPRKAANINHTSIVAPINNDSDCDQDSDSDGGGSRLMLAKSAPKKVIGGAKSRPKRSNKKKAIIDVSSEEDQSSQSDNSE